MIMHIIILVFLLSTSLSVFANEESTVNINKESVVVIGEGSQIDLTLPYAGDQVATGSRAGLLGNLDFMDSPFTGMAYTQKLIQDQQARSIGDVLQNDPVVRVTKGFGNFQELYMIRGFPVYSGDMTFNGVYGILPRQYLAAELVERVEVFRGANSFLNGAAPGNSGVGGAFNIVPKRAGDAPLTRLTVGFENDAQLFSALDAGRRFGDANQFGVRFNAVGRDGDFAIDNQKRSLKAFSIGADFQNGPLRLYADFGYQDHRLDDPRPQVTPTGKPPGPPDASNNFAQPWTFSEEQQLFGVARGELALSENVTFWLALGGRHGEEENRLANPTSNENGIGKASRFDNTREDTIYSADTGIRTKFSTWAIDHRLILSYSGFSSDSKNAYSSFEAVEGNIYNPSVAAIPTIVLWSGGKLSDPKRTAAVRNWSVAIADTMFLFNDKVRATVGVRHQSMRNRSFNYNTGDKNTNYSKSTLTPLGALVFSPNNWLAVYGNYAEALQRAGFVPALSGGTLLTNAGEALPAFRSKQVEFGLKIDRGNFGGTLAVFEITKPNSIVVGNRLTDSGEQRARGIELSMFGEPLDGVRVLGGATLVDATLEKTTDGVDNGMTPIGIPGIQANVNIEWDIPNIQGLTVDGRMIYTDKQYTNTANTFSIPSWTRFDIGARYAMTTIGGKGLVLRGRVENVTDNDYWASTGGYPGQNYLVLGSPLTFIMSASLDF